MPGGRLPVHSVRHGVGTPDIEATCRRRGPFTIVWLTAFFHRDPLGERAAVLIGRMHRSAQAGRCGLPWGIFPDRPYDGEVRPLPRPQATDIGAPTSTRCR
jgi:hypothetical protein